MPGRAKNKGSGPEDLEDAGLEEMEDQDREELEDPEDSEDLEKGLPQISVLSDGFKTAGFGLLKALKGLLSPFAGAVIGASGVQWKEVYRILNSPLQDWGQLWRKERDKLKKENIGSLSKLWRGVKGCGLGILNFTKEVVIGGLQAAGGGLAVVAVLKYWLGLKPEIIEAILKTGHPIGLIAGALLSGIDKAEALCKTLQTQLQKYESLGQVGDDALKAIERRDYRKGVERLGQAVDVVGQATGKDFSKVKRQIQRATEVGTLVSRKLESSELKMVADIVSGAGIDPKQLIEGGKVLVKNLPAALPAQKKLEVINKILDSNPSFGLVARAASFEDALAKLIERQDLNIIERLAVVNLKGGGALSPEQVEQLKAAAKEKVQALLKKPELTSSASAPILPQMVAQISKSPSAAAGEGPELPKSQAKNLEKPKPSAG